MADEEGQQLLPGQEELKKLGEKSVLLTTALPVIAIPMIVIGHLYLLDCRVQPLLPVFLLVAGYSNVLSFLLNTGVACCWRDGMPCRVVRFWGRTLSSFITVWYIVGSVWVYGVKKVEFEDTTSQEYCNKTVYLFTCWLLTLIWSATALVIGIMLLCCCCALAFKSDDD